MESDHSCRFDPASLLILDRLDQVLHRLDQASGSGLVTAALHEEPATSALPNLNQHSNGPESWANQLSIPAARIGPDTVLAWPVFDGQFDRGLFNRSVACGFQVVAASDTDMAFEEDECPNISSQLVENFLQHVHIKNPVLNVDRILDLTAESIDNGQTLGNSSCLLVSPSKKLLLPQHACSSLLVDHLCSWLFRKTSRDRLRVWGAPAKLTPARFDPSSTKIPPRSEKIARISGMRLNRGAMLVFQRRLSHVHVEAFRCLAVLFFSFCHALHSVAYTRRHRSIRVS